MLARHNLTRYICLPILLALTACGGDDQATTPTSTVPPAPPPVPTPVPPPTPTQPFLLSANIRYGDGPTASGAIPLLLDLYQPNQSCTVRRPTVMFVHGGGFTSGSRKGASVEAIASELAQLGINLVSIQYRLEGDAPTISPEFARFENDYRNLVTNLSPARVRAFVAAVEDSVRALRWMQDNANQFCIDPANLGLWGSSAGAFTVLHVAYSLNPYAITRPEPRVVVDYWGGLFRDSDIEANETPLFVLHGTADATVPFSEATELTARARQVGVPFTFYSITNGGHDFNGSGFFVRRVDGQSIAKRTADFVSAHLRIGGIPLYESRTVD